jgi:predicted amidohydrolase
MMRIGYVQNDPAYGEPVANLREVDAAMGPTPADLWILPELFASGYLLGDRGEAERLAEPIPDGPTTQGLLRIARERGCAMIAGLPERAGSATYNAAIAVDPTGLRAVYRKIHLFSREKEWFDPGDLPFAVIDLAGARVGIMICWDWRFPEAARTLTLAGAQVIAHPSNLVLPHCQAAMVTRALENRVYVATVNRIGRETRAGSDLVFTGGSRIVSPEGRVLSDAPAGAAAVQVVEIDPALADDKWATPQNDLFADRRPSFYRT